MKQSAGCDLNPGSDSMFEPGSFEDLKSKINVTAWKEFDSTVGVHTIFSLEWRIRVVRDNWVVPFKDLPKNLIRPKETKIYNIFWGCYCRARLLHGV